MQSLSSFDYFVSIVLLKTFNFLEMVYNFLIKKRNKTINTKSKYFVEIVQLMIFLKKNYSWQMINMLNKKTKVLFTNDDTTSS